MHAYHLLLIKKNKFIMALKFDYCENCGSSKIETVRKDENTFCSHCEACGINAVVAIKKAAITAASQKQTNEKNYLVNK